MRCAAFAALLMALMAGISDGDVDQRPKTKDQSAGSSVIGPSSFVNPKPVGDRTHVVRIGADAVFRWQEGETTLLDLRGNAVVSQGAFGISAPRLMAWLRESREDGEKAGLLEVYGEKEADQRPKTNDQSAASSVTGPSSFVFRLVASAGVVLSGGIVPGERPAGDPFLSRALVGHGDMPPEAPADPRSRSGAGGERGLFGNLRPSAETMTVADLGEAGVVVTLSGNAEVVSDDMFVSADAIRIRVLERGPMTSDQGRSGIVLGRRSFVGFQVQSLYAEGSVDLQRGDERLTAQAVYLDWQTEQGLATDARIRIIEGGQNIPVQFYASAVREEGFYRFSAHGKGYFTTSQMAEPHWRIEGTEIQMVRGPGPQRAHQRISVGETAGTFSEKPLHPATAPSESLVVSSRNNAVYIESVPIMYWPYVAKDVRSGAFLIKSVRFGSSSNLGSFLGIEWDLYDLGIYSNDWSELTLRTDAFSARGLGVGADFAYRATDRLGFARGYYIHDTAKEDDLGLPVPQEKRGEATWRDRELLPDGWRADLELGYLSDRQFLRTYDRNALDEDKDRETQIFLSRISHNTLVTAQAKVRLNDFQNQVERDSVAYHVVGERIGDTPLLWTTHTDLSRLNLRMDDALHQPSPDSVVRFDTAHEISRPLQIGFIRAEPFLWGDVTGFSKQADDEGSAGRAASAFGLRAASNFYRTYDAHSALFQVDSLRHTITPTVEYLNLWGVSRSPEHFIQQDEIDALDQSHQITLGLRNRLQTHREVDGQYQSVEFASADLAYVRSFDPEASGPNGHFKKEEPAHGEGDYVEASARWRVTENIELVSLDNRYDTERSRVEALDGEVNLNFWRPVTLSLIHKYYLDLNTAGDPAHSVSVLQAAYQPLYSRWLVGFSTAYDFQAQRVPSENRDPRLLGSSIFFTRQMEGWDFTVSVEFNQGLANETVVRFSITPPGVRRRSPLSRSYL